MPDEKDIPSGDYGWQWRRKGKKDVRLNRFFGGTQEEGSSREGYNFDFIFYLLLIFFWGEGGVSAVIKE